MATLYITSQENGSGKTSICAGLASHLTSNGRKVAYLKPVIGSKAESADSDAALMKQLLALDESTDLISPNFSDGASLLKGINNAVSKTGQGKDTVIIEGIAAQSAIEAMDAQVIAVETMSTDLDTIITAYKNFGSQLLGIIINKVPTTKLKQVRAEASAALEQAGIKLLGVLPEDRTLIAMTVTELAELLQGEIISGSEKSLGLVENFMMGALSIDPGPHYFGRKANKAVILRSGRTDMQLATLETSTSCMVLTGSEAIQPVVLDRAKEKSVPIILTGDELPDVAASIETAIGKSGFNQEKLGRIGELLDQNFDSEQLHKRL